MHSRNAQPVRPARLPFAAVTVRPAEPGDVEALRDIAAAAYRHYVPRIGHPPAPMTADYAQAIRRRQAWVAVDGGEVTGLLS